MSVNNTVGIDTSTAGGSPSVTAMAPNAAATQKVAGFVLPNKFDLAQHATLLRVRIRAWSARSKCDEAADDAAQVGGADDDVITAYIQHVPKNHPLKAAVTQAYNKARNFYKDPVNTGYWDKGTRLLTNLQYDRVMSALRAMRLEFLQAVENFLNGLPELEALAAGKQGKYTGRFPSRAELEDRFEFEIRTMAIADPNDIRLQHVSAETAREIERQTRETYNEQVGEVVNRLVTHIGKTVKHFVEKMDDEGQKYHGTTVTNVQELAALIPSANLLGDPELNNIAREMSELFAPLEVKELKKDPKLREATKAKASTILERVRQMTISKDI